MVSNFFSFMESEFSLPWSAETAHDLYMTYILSYKTQQIRGERWEVRYS